MSQTVQRIVQRLRAISAPDRDWLLHRLSAEERRVLAALVGERDASSAPNGDRHSTPTNGHSIDTKVTAGRAGAELAALNDLPFEDVVALLDGESDWTVVVLLQAANWPWADDFLRSLPTARLHDLRELSDRLGDSVRPKVKDAVARLIAGRVLERTPRNARRSMFDLVLEHAQRASDVDQEQRAAG